MKGDYRVCATGVTTHCDEVLDCQPDVGAGCRCLGGGGYYGAMATRGVDEDVRVVPKEAKGKDSLKTTCYGYG
jgi:hypothetical protein